MNLPTPAPEQTDVTAELQALPAAVRAELLAATISADAARQTARGASVAQAIFLTDMARATRTSVAAMLGHAQLLEMGLAEQGDVLQRLRSSGSRLLTLLDDVLALARLQAGRTIVGREPAMTGDAVGAALLLTLGAVPTRGVRVVDESGNTRGVAYVGDERRVREILVTLVETASELATAGGTITVRCSTTSERSSTRADLAGDGPWTSICVEDPSGGLAAGERAGCFEAFHGRELGLAESKHDAGLGFAISRGLARLMGGDLTVEHAPGDGAAFALWLPATADGESAADRVARARDFRA